MGAISLGLDLSATDMIEMIERLFVARETVNKYDVVQIAKLYPLGEDGERAIAALPSKRYTKDALTEALAASLIDSIADARPKPRR